MRRSEQDTPARKAAGTTRRRLPGGAASVVVAGGLVLAFVLAFVVMPQLREREAGDPLEARYPPLEIKAERERLGERVNVRPLGLRLSGPRDWQRLEEEELEGFAVASSLSNGEDDPVEVLAGTPLVGWLAPRPQVGTLLVFELNEEALREARLRRDADTLQALSEAHIELTAHRDDSSLEAHGSFSVGEVRVARTEEVRTRDGSRMVVIRYLVGRPFDRPFAIQILCRAEDYDEAFQQTFLSVLGSMRALHTE